MNYLSLYQAIRQGSARESVPRWAIGALSDVAEGRRPLLAIRHPLGFICLPLVRDGADGVCVHLWTPQLEQARPTTSPVHAHSWDLISYVLFGEVRNEFVRVEDAAADEAGAATHRLFEVRSLDQVDEIRPTPRLVRCQRETAGRSTAGDVYSVSAGTFHATVTQPAEDAATVALGRHKPGTIDRSLGAPGTGTHRVVREFCDRDETAHAARIIAARLSAICSA